MFNHEPHEMVNATSRLRAFLKSLRSGFSAVLSGADNGLNTGGVRHRLPLPFGRGEGWGEGLVTNSRLPTKVSVPFYTCQPCDCSSAIRIAVSPHPQSLSPSEGEREERPRVLTLYGSTENSEEPLSECGRPRPQHGPTSKGSRFLQRLSQCHVAAPGDGRTPSEFVFTPQRISRLTLSLVPDPFRVFCVFRGSISPTI